jgi:hypothetical protein
VSKVIATERSRRSATETSPRRAPSFAPYDTVRLGQVLRRGGWAARKRIAEGAKDLRLALVDNIVPVREGVQCELDEPALKLENYG